MRSRHRSFALGVAVAVVTATTVVACGDENASRAFEEADAGGPPGASLPEAAVEAAPERDAGDERAPFDPADEPVSCAAAGTPCATQIVAGSNHFCARMSTGAVRCWGDDSFGALGEAEPEPKPDPDAGKPPAPTTSTRTVAGIAEATQLSAAGHTTCARVNGGAVLCWGANTNGQLGRSAGKPDLDYEPHPTPSAVALPGKALRVDVGDVSACAVLTTGALWCWGNDEQAQLARAATEPTFVLGPGEAVVGALGIAKIGVGSTTMLALTASGEVASWGAVGGKDGVLAGRMSSISPDPAPNRITLKGVSSLAVTPSLFQDEGAQLATGIGPGPPPGGGPARHAHACVVAAGEVMCWGRSDRGALCTGFPDVEPLPAHAPIESKAWAQQVAVGDEITCARMTDGSIQCCGDDAHGRLGTGSVGLFSALFAPAAAFKGHAVQVAASNRAVCALVQGGTVECWGGNLHGELATSVPDESDHATPSKVAF
ncbi:MAG: hypothetical protein JWP87_6317 [Labilithrix sp.]|jgi:alpha-tubulin suppressor-like RCC1 family protein|nr:hypothetical protein [Labilithrix sp.]